MKHCDGVHSLYFFLPVLGFMSPLAYALDTWLVTDSYRKRKRSCSSIWRRYVLTLRETLREIGAIKILSWSLLWSYVFLFSI